MAKPYRIAIQRVTGYCRSAVRLRTTTAAAIPPDLQHARLRGRARMLGAHPEEGSGPRSSPPGGYARRPAEGVPASKRPQREPISVISLTMMGRCPAPSRRERWIFKMTVPRGRAMAAAVRRPSGLPVASTTQRYSAVGSLPLADAVATRWRRRSAISPGGGANRWTFRAVGVEAPWQPASRACHRPARRLFPPAGWRPGPGFRKPPPEAR